jgi:hypothetical protein
VRTAVSLACMRARVLPRARLNRRRAICRPACQLARHQRARARARAPRQPMFAPALPSNSQPAPSLAPASLASRLQMAA